jgi:hypothetical protein
MTIKNLVPSKRTALKLSILIFLAGSLYLNYWLAKQHFNFRCEVNYQIVGYMTTKEQCNDISEDFYAAREVERLQMVEEMNNE